MLPSDPAVSVVIPCYNEVGTLHELHARIRAEFAALGRKAEIIFIDDGSIDGTTKLLYELAAVDPDCRLIIFRKNTGKAAALEVGFRAARGEIILTMDADLQDDPKEIPRFLDALARVDLVSGWKATRHDPLGKTLPSKLFNATVRRVTGVKLHDMNCGFKGYRRQVVDEMSVYGEMHRFLPALAASRGFRVAEIPVTHHPRRSGVSKYGWERFIRGFLDLVTVTYITQYRFRPLHLFGSWAVGLFAFSILLGAALSIPMTMGLQTPPWHAILWALGMACFIISPLLFAIGMVAEGLLANTFHQQPQPPIAERVNFEQATAHVNPALPLITVEASLSTADDAPADEVSHD